MSILRINQISNKTDNGSPTFTKGVVVAPGYALTCSGINITGVITATSFSGDGTNLINLPTVSASKAVALKRLFHYDETLSS